MNIERVTTVVNIIDSMYDFNKQINPDIDESFLDNLIEQYINNPKFPLSEEEKKRVIAMAKYDCIAKHDDGKCLTDDYEHEEWYTKLLDEDNSYDEFFWNRYREYLKSNPKSGLTMPAINRLDFGTLRDLMNLLGNPRSENSFFRKGLIIGDVQSGKTSTYIGYICKAADAGYKVIVLLAGTTESLRWQTQKRVEEGFVGFDITANENGHSARVGVGLDGKPLQVTAMTSRDDDFVGNKNKIMTSLENNRVVLCIVKKNATVLDKLIDWLKTSNIDESIGKIPFPMLLIDDEADNASINTRKDADNPTKINDSIRKLLDLFVQRTYVGFTATPFANVFIDPDANDIFPENFIYVLPTPDAYIGASKIFYDDGQYHSALRYITDAGMVEKDGFPFYAKHKRDWKGAFPNSLTDAIYTFLLANAIRDLRGDNKEPRGMLIHMSRFIPVHKYIQEYVTQEFQKIYRKIQFDLPSDKNTRQIFEIKKLYQMWEENYSELEFTWDQVCDILLESIENIQILVINSDKDADKLDYDKNKDLRAIVIGGPAISRGITIEGLVVSYFFRNTATFDVLMQMGRWFGYRPNYEDIFRVWVGEKSVEWYVEIAQSVEILKRDLNSMIENHKSPREFGVRVKNDSEELKITASNKMRTAEMYIDNFSYFGSFFETHYLLSDYEKNQKNWSSVLDLIRANIGEQRKMPDQKEFVLRNVPKAEIIKLMSSLQIEPSNDYFNPKNYRDFLERSSISGLEKWNVVIANGQKTNPVIPNGKTEFGEDIYSVLRSSRIDGDDRIVVGNNGKLTVPSDGLLGLDESTVLREEMDAAKAKFKDEYLKKKKAEFTKDKDSDFPATVWYKYITNREPTLIVYYLKINAHKNCGNNDLKARSEAVFNEHELGWIGFAVGIPNCGSSSEEHIFYVSKDWKGNNIDEYDVEENYEE
ncbi:Z1 domain-containing protein [Butyrivibrio sp. AE2032]|uniref:Z1 domain-containing protein n=1 Tax=Butyrivibrio sp. AE2032 TaxID=1458463 RepID=UPI00068B6358|nr:Z1 domain-containing protein [Butyrivibrio sp. AE2032]